jgi:hypothetical protein
MPGVSLPLRRGFGETTRRDRWWVQPLLVFVGFGLFLVYATWAALQGEHYTFGPYLSPFYSPELWGHSPHAWFGALPSWWPAWLPYSPAYFILWAPAGFRMTCYYYRGAYYKAFWADPPACAVGEPRKGYIGDSNWPLRIQNIHRYFLYVAVLFIGMLTWDAIKAFWFDGRFGGADGERGAAGRVHVRLPLPATPGRRAEGLPLGITHLSQAVQGVFGAEPPPPAVGVDEPVLGHVRRRVRAAVRDGGVEGLQADLTLL